MATAAQILQKQKLDRYLGKSIDNLPMAIVYFDPEDGSVLKYNHSAVDAVMRSTGLPSMPTTIFADMDKLSFVADRMRKHEEFEFYVTYDMEQKRFVPLTHISGASPFNVLVVQTFNALDSDGGFLACGMQLRPLIDSQEDVLFSDLESAKYNTVSELFGMTELTFHPDELTLDVVGGRDHYKLQGAPIEELSKILHPDDFEKLMDTFVDASVQYPDKIRITARVYSIKYKSYRYFRMMFYPQIDSLGHILSYGGFCIDVNEEKMAANKKIEEANAIIEAHESKPDERGIITALANICHDLRNPIGIIMGISDMMAQSENAEERRKFNSTVQESSQRLLKMANEILNLNRIEFGNLEVHNHTFDLDEMLHRFTELYVLQFRSKDLELSFESHEHPVIVDTDETRIVEILDNYMSNALKYTKKGKVTIRYDESPDSVTVHIVDTGRGISAEDCKKVFDRFQKLDSNVKGNGIGLHICRGIADALGATVGVDSQLGVGSDFWVKIPRDTASDTIST